MEDLDGPEVREIVAEAVKPLEAAVSALTSRLTQVIDALSVMVSTVRDSNARAAALDCKFDMQTRLLHQIANNLAAVSEAQNVVEEAVMFRSDRMQ